MTELNEPPQIRLRRLPGLLARAARLTWTAAPRELLLVLGLQSVGGLGLVLPILLGRDLLASLTGGGDVPGSVILQGITILILLGTLNLATALALGRDEILSELIARHAQRLILDVACTVELERFERPEFHNRLDRASMSASMRPHQLAQALGTLAQAAMGSAGALLAVLAIQPALAPVTLVAGVPLWLAGVRSGHALFSMIHRITPAERERAYLLNLLTSRSPAKEIRAYGLARHLRGRWERRTGERLSEIRRTVRVRLWIMLVARTISGLAIGVVLVLLAVLARTGRMPVADAVAAGGAVLLLGSRLRAAAAGTDQLFEAAPFLADLTTFLQLAQPADQKPRTPAPTGFQHLTVEDVTFTYPSGDRPALRGVSMEIQAGQVVALVGENGSGKTTLAKLLARLYRPQSGRICYDDVDLADADPGGLRENVAVLFQDFQRYLLSVTDNIAAGRWERADDRAAVEEAAARAGADGLVAALPYGYDSLLGPEFAGGTDLSGGQWQRIALARAFFRDASFVVLDEPTASLDARAEHELFDRMRTLAAGRTVLLISHRFSTVRSADRIYVMADGRIAEHGTHDQLIAAAGRYAELFKLQAAGYVEARSGL